MNVFDRHPWAVVAALTSCVSFILLEHSWPAALVFGVSFMARFLLQPTQGALLTIPRRALLIVLAWIAMAAFAWPFALLIAKHLR